MPDGLWMILFLIGIVIVITIVRVRQYMRRSEELWQEADKSKLRKWDDDDDWDGD